MNADHFTSHKGGKERIFIKNNLAPNFSEANQGLRYHEERLVNWLVLIDINSYISCLKFYQAIREAIDFQRKFRSDTSLDFGKLQRNLSAAFVLLKAIKELFPNIGKREDDSPKKLFVPQNSS